MASNAAEELPAVVRSGCDAVLWSRYAAEPFRCFQEEMPDAELSSDGGGHLAVDQIGDLACGQSQHLAEDLFGMFTEPRCRPRRLPVVSQIDGAARGEQSSDAGLVDLGQHRVGY